jgi:hypothetical protein
MTTQRAISEAPSNDSPVAGTAPVLDPTPWK